MKTTHAGSGMSHNKVKDRRGEIDCGLRANEACQVEDQWYQTRTCFEVINIISITER